MSTTNRLPKVTYEAIKIDEGVWVVRRTYHGGLKDWTMMRHRAKDESRESVIEAAIAHGNWDWPAGESQGMALAKRAAEGNPPEQRKASGKGG